MRTIALLLLLGVSAPSQSGEAEVRFWRTPLACGVNCVSLLATIEGATVAYDSVLDKIALNERGATLLQLEEACQSLGLPYVAVKGDPMALVDLGGPVVAHMDHWTGRVDETGHFLLLTDVQEANGTVRFVDPITVTRHSTTMDAFRRAWSGYALVRKRRTWMDFTSVLLGVVGVVGGIVGGRLLLGLIRIWRA